MKNKKVVLITILALVILGGISFSALHYQKIEAQRIAQEELEARIKKEKEILNEAEIAMELAYRTRKEDDIKTAETAISKLNNKQKKDKQSLSNKLSKLTELLKQLDDIEKELIKTEKSKSQADIDATQKLIDKMTDDYLKKNKEEIQKKLDKINADKAKSDKEKADKAKAEQLTKEQTQVGDSYTPSINNESSGYTPPTNNNYNYTPPSNNAGSSNDNNSQNTPTPVQPPSKGNDISGTDAPNGHEMEPGGFGTQGTNDINGWEIDTEY